MTQLILAKDAPTHKMTVKLEDGTYRMFYLTEKEAVWFADNINSVHPNIAFTAAHRHIDPSAPSFYPKRGAWMERLSREEIEERRRCYVTAVQESTSAEEAEREKAARSKAVRDWIESHQRDFTRMKAEAKARLESGKGYYHAASKGVKVNLVYGEAWRAVDELLTQQDTSGRKETDVD